MQKNVIAHTSHLSRHAHDIHAAYKSSLVPGPIVPQYFHILGPKDTIYISSNLFARMQDVVTAFLGEIDFHLDYFFVPLQMLYTPFGQAFSQTDDFISDLLSGTSRLETFPTVNIDSPLGGIDPRQYYSGHQESIGKETCRLLDALNMNPLGCLANRSVIPSTQAANAIAEKYCKNGSISIFIPAAYQAIYQKYFRNDALERLDVSAYNYDSWFNGSTPSSERVRNLLKLRYISRPSDYFTNTRVSPLGSAINSIFNAGLSNAGEAIFDEQLMHVTNWLDAGHNEIYPQSFGDDVGVTSDSGLLSTSLYSSSDQTDSLSYLSTSNIRSLFAVDKYARIWGNAKKTYDDQILAHFGVKIPHDVKHDITHVAHFRKTLGSTPVVSSSNSSVYNSQQDDVELYGSLGQIGGQASCTLEANQVKFTAPVHGVFMVVAYCVTKPSYQGTFSRLHKLTDRLCFPIPEFDKLGAQPLFGYEFNPIGLTNQGLFFGWQNRWQEFKQKYNRVSLTYYKPTSWFYNESDPQTNIYTSWVVSRGVFERSIFDYDDEDYAESCYLDTYKFWENPNALNQVLVRPYSGVFDVNTAFVSPWLLLQSDPFILDYYADAKLISWMSETGEPDL